MNLERTLVFLKPDALQRRLAGEIISRFEKRGFLIVGMKLIHITEEFARRHYSAHAGKDFFEPLVRYTTCGPCIAMVLEGKNAVKVARSMLGETFGGESPSGTVRGDYSLSNRFNLIHGSDSTQTAEDEIKRFFRSEELVSYSREDIQWIYDTDGAGIV